MSASMIGALRVTLGLDSAEFDTGLKKAQSNLKGAGSGFQMSAKSMSVAGMAVGAAFATAAVAIGAAIKSSIDHADELSKAAQKFGVPVAELSRLEHAANLSDVSLDQLGTGLKKLSAAMSDLAGGGASKAGDAFRALGISVKNADGSLKSNTQVMTEVAGKFGDMQDGAGKTALAMAIFGKSGADLIPLLNSGSAGLKEMTDEADALGLTLDENTAKAAENFNDNLTRMGAIGKGLSTQLMAGLLPSLVSVSDVMVSGAKNTEFMAEVSSVLNGVIKSLATSGVVLGAVFDATYKTVVGVVKAAQQIGQGDIKGAIGTLNQKLDSFEGINARIKAIWSQTGAQAAGLPRRPEAPVLTGGGSAGRAGKSAAEKAADEAARELERQRDRVKDLFDSLMSNNEEVTKRATENTKALWAAFERGDITFDKLQDGLERIRTATDSAMEGFDVVGVKVPEITGEIVDMGAKAREAGEGVQSGFDLVADAVNQAADAFYSTQYAIEDAFHALEDRDWVGVITGIVAAVKALGEAWKTAGTKAEVYANKASAVAGVAGAVGNAVGGKVGNFISGAASGAAAGSVFGPVGTVIGAIIGGGMTLLDGDKKQRQQANQQAAIAAYNKQMEILNAKRQLELQLMQMQGKGAEALALARADELAKMDAESAAIQRQIWELEDATKVRALEAQLAKLQGDATRALALEREAELAALSAGEAAIQKQIYAYEDLASVTAQQNALVDDARGDLTAAYNKESRALQDTIDTFTALAQSLRAYGKSLTTGASSNLNPLQQYKATKAEFDRVSALARTGDKQALADLQGVSEAYLSAAKAVAPDARTYAIALAQVRDAVDAAATYAETQVSAAEAQLEQLKTIVSTLITINESVLSVVAAIAALQAAQIASADAIAAAMASVAAANDNAANSTSDPAKIWTPEGYAAANADVASWAKSIIGTKGYDGQVITSEADALAYHWANHGKFEGRGFKTGGTFEVGGFGGTDSQLMQFNATPGEMGVVTHGDTLGTLARGVVSLADRMGRQEAALTAIAVNTRKTAIVQERWEGGGLPATRVV
jgi:hypothetical protein